MDSRLSWETVQARVLAHRRAADSAGWHALRSREASRHPGASLDRAAVTVRFATPGDAPALDRLAALDSGSVPAGTALVAEVDGEVLAALSLGDGTALADPFRPTPELLRLLDLRAAQLRGTGRRRAWRPRFRTLRPARVE